MFFTPTLEFSEDDLSVSNTAATWTDVTADLQEIEWFAGRTSELDEPQPGGMRCRLRNTNQRWTPDYAAGEFFPNIDTERRFRLSMRAASIEGIEFWGDFEAGADGTAPEWTAMNGFVEGLAGAAARQFQYVTSPTPRLGARILRAEVAPGDQFGSTTGERAEVRRGTPNGGFGTGNLEGQTVYTQFSFQALSPFTRTGEVVIQQTHDSGSTYGAPFFRWRIGTSPATFDFRVVTGRYPNSTDAGNGVNAGTSKTHTGRAFTVSEWWDFRHVVYYTTGDGGWYTAQMKKSTETDWTTVADVHGVPTLPSYPGSGATSQYDKLGVYRGSADPVNTIVGFFDGFQVGHSWTDVGYPTSTPDALFNQITFKGKQNILDLQVGNADFEADVTGTAAAGGGTTTLSWDTTRSKFGDGALKLVTNGAASGQGAFHRKRSGSRFDVTGGIAYTASAWFSGDGGEEVRVGIEYSDSGGSVISTTYCPPRATRTDFRRLYVTVTAPSNAVTARVRTGLSGTNAATFWVDGVGFWEGVYELSATEGIWYTESFEIDFPTRKGDYSEVVVSCVDGMGLLATEALPSLHPAEATGYEDAIDYSQPWGYWRMGEPEGTKAVSHSRRKRKRHKGESKRHFRRHGVRHWKTRETRAEVEGQAGPAGTYKGRPTLGVPGLILGDSDTAVQFDGVNDYAIVSNLDVDDLTKRNRITVEAWIKPANTTGYVLSSPRNGILNAFALLVAFGNLTMRVQGSGPTATIATSSGAPISVGNVYHVAGTWDGSTAKAYINGVEVASQGGALEMTDGASSNALIIGGLNDGSPPSILWNGVLDEVAIYEKALEPATILHHYEAGAQRGYASQLTGSRIVAVASDTLWTTDKVTAGAFQMQPRMQFGQPRLEAIMEAAMSEVPRSHFFFDGSGDPVYLDFDYTYAANTGTFATDDVPFLDAPLVYDNEIYNTVKGSTDGGDTLEATNTASVASRKIKVRDEELGLPLESDDDVQTVISTILDDFSTPLFRPASVTIVDSDETRAAHALNHEIGEWVRVRVDQASGHETERQCVILGWKRSFDARARVLQTTYDLSRGFDSTVDGWRLGMTDFAELGTNTVLA